VADLEPAEPYRMQQRGAQTRAEILTANEILLERELCVAIDTGDVWVGDGVTPVAQLPTMRDGLPGEPGDSAYQVWLENGHQGTVEDFLASLVGADGNAPVAAVKVYDTNTTGAPDFTVAFDDGAPFVAADEQNGITSKIRRLRGLDATGARFETLSDDTGLAFAVVYEDPTTKLWKLQWGIRDDGTLYMNTAAPLPPGPDVMWGGDSLSQGAGGNGTNAPGVLQAQMVANGKPGTVRNLGVGGEQSPEIAARVAGGTMLAMPEGGTWPASGSVNIVVTNDDKVVTTSFILQGSAGLNPCTIAGAVWTVTYNTGTSKYVATRVGTGAAIPATRPSAIISAASRDRASDVFVLWAGRNNATATARVLSDVATMVRHQRAALSRALVLGVLNGANEGTGTGVYNAIVNLNATEKQLYGTRFLDVRRYLIDYGLTDAGITPTTQDQADLTADLVPTSLRSDGIHLNATGYTLVGKLVYGRLAELGWI